MVSTSGSAEIGNGGENVEMRNRAERLSLRLELSGRPSIRCIYS